MQILESDFFLILAVIKVRKCKYEEHMLGPGGRAHLPRVAPALLGLLLKRGKMNLRKY